VLVADSDELRDYCRENLTTICGAAPEPVHATLDNRRVLTLDNASRLMFQTAGPRSGKKLGIGRGVSFIHGTEVPLWGLPRAMTYLRTRFSDAHPQRLAVFEGTSRGRNFWFDLWHDAAGA